VSLLIPFLLFICVTPLANAGPKFWLGLYVLPVLGLAYVLVTRTSADGATIRTSGLFGGTRIPWSDLDRFEFSGPRWAVAVTSGGRRVRLPMVRPRDLPQLASVSGGRLFLGVQASENAENAGATGPDSDQVAPPAESAAAGDEVAAQETVPAGEARTESAHTSSGPS
jgi:hypothetical protein